jgi:hypothetical protein
MAVSPGVEDEAPRASKRKASTETGVAMVLRIHKIIVTLF